MSFNLYVDLNSKEYRDAFVAAHVRNGIAFQLRAMRDRREWDQKKVASLMGNEKLQPVISRYENPDYGRMSVSTLIDLANAYDVGLIVTFAPFSEMVERDDALPQQSLDVEGYQEEKDRLAKEAGEISWNDLFVIAPSDPISIPRADYQITYWAGWTGAVKVDQQHTYQSFETHDLKISEQIPLDLLILTASQQDSETPKYAGSN